MRRRRLVVSAGLTLLVISALAALAGTASRETTRSESEVRPTHDAILELLAVDAQWDAQPGVVRVQVVAKSAIPNPRRLAEEFTVQEAGATSRSAAREDGGPMHRMTLRFEGVSSPAVLQIRGLGCRLDDSMLYSDEWIVTPEGYRRPLIRPWEMDEVQLERWFPSGEALADDLWRPTAVVNLGRNGGFHMVLSRALPTHSPLPFRLSYRSGGVVIAGVVRPEGERSYSWEAAQPLDPGAVYEVILSGGAPAASQRRLFARVVRDGVLKAEVVNLDRDDVRRPDLLVLRRDHPVALLRNTRDLLPLMPEHMANSRRFSDFLVIPGAMRRERVLLAGVAPDGAGAPGALSVLAWGGGAPGALQVPEAPVPWREHRASLVTLAYVDATRTAPAFLVVGDFFGRHQAFSRRSQDQASWQELPVRFDENPAWSGVTALTVLDEREGARRVLALRPGQAPVMWRCDARGLAVAQEQFPDALLGHFTATVVAADFDRDGSLDLVFLGAQDRHVAVRETRPGVWTEMPAWGAMLTKRVGARVRDAVAADLTRDGILDLAVVTTDRGVLLLPGRMVDSPSDAPLLPPGTAPSQAAPAVGPGPFSQAISLETLLGIEALDAQVVRAADFTGDRRLDLYLGTPDDDLFVVFPESFQEPRFSLPRYQARAIPSAGEVADQRFPLDLDGDSRIEWLERHDTRVLVRPDDPADTRFAGMRLPRLPRSEEPWRLLARDFDGDRQDDLLWRTTRQARLWLWRGAQTGYHSQPLGEHLAAADMADAVLADLDGDGLPDWVQPDHDGRLRIFAHRGRFWSEGDEVTLERLTPDWAGGAGDAPPRRLAQAAAADFTGDELPDLLLRVELPGEARDELVLLVQDAPAGGAFSTPISLGFVARDTSFEIGDFGADVLPDLWLRPTGSAELSGHVMINRTRPGMEVRFSPAAAVTPLQGVHTVISPPRHGDVDGDGLDDLVWAEVAGDILSLRVSRNDGSGRYDDGVTLGAWPIPDAAQRDAAPPHLDVLPPPRGQVDPSFWIRYSSADSLWQTHGLKRSVTGH